MKFHIAEHLIKQQRNYRKSFKIQNHKNLPDRTVKTGSCSQLRIRNDFQHWWHGSRSCRIALKHVSVTNCSICNKKSEMHQPYAQCI